MAKFYVEISVEGDLLHDKEDAKKYLAEMFCDEMEFEQVKFKLLDVEFMKEGR